MNIDTTTTAPAMTDSNNGFLGQDGPYQSNTAIVAWRKTAFTMVLLPLFFLLSACGT